MKTVIQRTPSVKPAINLGHFYFHLPTKTVVIATKYNEEIDLFEGLFFKDGKLKTGWRFQELGNYQAFTGTIDLEIVDGR